MRRLTLPVMQCDADCGDCCGPVLCHPHELKAVKDYAAAQGVEPVAHGVTCPFYQHGKCQVYPVRPYICRLFGHSSDLVCSRGHNVNILRSLERRLTKEYGRPSVFLHEALPDGLALLQQSLRGAVTGAGTSDRSVLSGKTA